MKSVFSFDGWFQVADKVVSKHKFRSHFFCSLFLNLIKNKNDLCLILDCLSFWIHASKLKNK